MFGFVNFAGICKKCKNICWKGSGLYSESESIYHFKCHPTSIECNICFELFPKKILHKCEFCNFYMCNSCDKLWTQQKIKEKKDVTCPHCRRIRNNLTLQLFDLSILLEDGVISYREYENLRVQYLNEYVQDN